MRIPDWLIYTLVLVVVLGTLFWRGGETPASRPAPVEVAEVPDNPEAADGPPLPDCLRSYARRYPS